MPAQDLYIEKDSSINDEIDRLRHAATAALLARRDVIIVASVSCIYGIGSPSLYRNQMQLFKVGETIDRDKVLRKLVRLQYERNDSSLTRGGFRVQGRGDRDHALLRRDGLPDLAVRGRDRSDPPLRPADRGDPRRGPARVDLAGDALRDRGGLGRALARGDPDRARQPAGRAGGRRQGPRGPSASPAHDVRPRDDPRDRLHLGDRELLADLRRSRSRHTATYPDRLLPRRLRHLHRRVPPDDPPDRRHVHGRPLPQADPGRLRLPSALGDRQPPAEVRRVHGADQPAGAGLGHTGPVRAGRVEPGGRADRAPDRRSSTPRSRSVRPSTRSTT